MIYLDNAATTFPKPECVYKKLDEANRKLAFNSGRGSYKKTKKISKIIDETREQMASLVGITNANNVVLLSSATEALNKIILGLDYNDGDIIYISPFEHNSIIRPLEFIRKKYNIKIKVLPFDKTTWTLSDSLNDVFALENPKYIFMSAKSNVCGYKLPFKEVFEIGKKYNSINILDASQSFGVDKSINCANTDFIVFAGHKSLYANFGVAGFIITGKDILHPVFFGGTGSDSMNPNMPDELPTKYEAGSKNIVSIIALNESLKWLKCTDVEEKEIMLTKYLIRRLKEVYKVKIYLPLDEEKCIGVVSINVDGYLPDEVGQILDDEFDICVRTGYHCSPLIHDFIGSKEKNGTVRISLNYFNTEKDIDELINALKTL